MEADWKLGAATILEGGTIIACAPHEELLRTCEVYRDIPGARRTGG